MPDSRVGARVSVKLSTGNYGSVGLELWEECDVSGLMDEKQTRQAMLKRLQMEVDDWKAGQQKTAPSSAALPTPSPTTLPKSAPTPVTPQVHTPVSTEIRTEPGSVAAVTDQMIEEELDRLDWLDNSKGTGWFAPLEEIPLTVRAALVNKFLAATGKSIRIGGYNYTRFGEDNGLIGKFAVRMEGKR